MTAKKSGSSDVPYFIYPAGTPVPEQTETEKEAERRRADLTLQAENAAASLASKICEAYIKERFRCRNCGNRTCTLEFESNGLHIPYQVISISKCVCDGCSSPFEDPYKAFGSTRASSEAEMRALICMRTSTLDSQVRPMYPDQFQSWIESIAYVLLNEGVNLDDLISCMAIADVPPDLAQLTGSDLNFSTSVYGLLLDLFKTSVTQDSILLPKPTVCLGRTADHLLVFRLKATPHRELLLSVYAGEEWWALTSGVTESNEENYPSRALLEFHLYPVESMFDQARVDSWNPTITTRLKHLIPTHAAASRVFQEAFRLNAERNYPTLSPYKPA